MKLKDILIGIEYECYGNNEIEIESICENTKTDCKNSVFVAIEGFSTDGHLFIDEAINQGAKAIVVEKKFDATDLLGKITIIKTINTRSALAKISCNFYNNPSKELKIIGVTGTKGKTTTTYMIKSILEQHGYKVRINWYN